jgi:hypothetical protein
VTVEVQSGRTRPSKWVILVTFQDGERRYYGGTGSDRSWTTARGNAMRYDSEIEARYHAHQLKEGYDRIVDFSIEEIKNARTKF